MAGDEV